MMTSASASILADVWDAHRKSCARCRSVDLARPASIADSCLEGARMFKDVAAAAHAELIAARSRKRVKHPQDELRGELSPAEERMARRAP